MAYQVSGPDELLGMLALAMGVAEQKWPHSVDAQVWVAEWLKTIAEHPTIPTDEGSMLGWFANAIMAGYDTANSRNAAANAALAARCGELERKLEVEYAKTRHWRRNSGTCPQCGTVNPFHQEYCPALASQAEGET